MCENLQLQIINRLILALFLRNAKKIGLKQQQQKEHTKFEILQHLVFDLFLILFIKENNFFP